VVGINGNIANYGHGTPRGEAQPNFGLPVWEPNVQPMPSWEGPINQAVGRWSRYDQSVRNNHPLPGQMHQVVQSHDARQRSHAHNIGLGHQAHRYNQATYPQYANQLNNTGMQPLFDQMRQYHNAEEIDFQYRNYQTRGFHPRVRQRRSYRGTQSGHNQNNHAYGASNNQRRSQHPAVQNFSYPNGANNHQNVQGNHSNNTNGFSPYSRGHPQQQNGWNVSQVPVSFPPPSQNTFGSWNDHTGFVQPQNQGYRSAWAATRIEPAATVPTGQSAAPDGSSNLYQHFRKSSK
jgi:hypothetical protein